MLCQLLLNRKRGIFLKCHHQLLKGKIRQGARLHVKTKDHPWETLLSETNQTQKIHIAQFHSEEAPRVVKQGGVKAEWIQDPPPPTHLLPTPRKNSEVNV